ncbi:MAG: flagellar basal-body rod protein FlgG [Gemmatimonadaceae bacterium]
MNPALRTAASGMNAVQRKSEVIANNLANVNTTAFKRSRAQFEDLLYQKIQGSAVLGGADAAITPAMQIGRGVKLSGVARIDAQGSLAESGRPLDVAIEGEGYLRVRGPNDQPLYTRDGALQVSDQGILVTSGGLAIEPGIRVEEGMTNLTISRSGFVSAQNGSGIVELGRIELARFTNTSGLEAMGENLYAETPGSGAAVTGYPEDEGFGRLVQGYLEGSNVEIVTEMVEMITAQRAYEINSKSVQAADQMSQTATQMVR